MYVLGALSPLEREHFELVLEFHDELRHFLNGLADAGAAVLLAGLRPADLETFAWTQGPRLGDDPRAFPTSDPGWFGGLQPGRPRAMDQSRLHRNVWVFAPGTAREKALARSYRARKLIQQQRHECAARCGNIARARKRF